MTSMQVTDILDVALEALRAGEPVEKIITRYPAHADTLAPLLRAALALGALRPVEEPTPEAARADRARFLAAVAGCRARSLPASRRTGLRQWLVSVLGRPERGTPPARACHGVTGCAGRAGRLQPSGWCRGTGPGQPAR